MANVFDQFDETAGTNPFDQFDTPVDTGAVKPGDVAARALQVQTEPQNFVAPTRAPTITGEFGGGVAEAAKGVRDYFGEQDPVKQRKAQLEAVLGANRAVAAPFAPIDKFAAKTGAGLQDWLLSKGTPETLAAVLATIGDMGVNLGATAGVGAIPKLVGKFAPGAVAKAQNFLKSGRTVAGEIEGQAAKDLSAIETANKQVGENVAARNESVQSIADAAARDVPTSAAIKAKAGTGLGEDVGAAFQKTYDAKQTASANLFHDLYEGKNGVLTKAGAQPGKTDSYYGALEKITGEKGVSQPNPTSAERAAGKAKSILNTEDERMDTIRALEDQLKSGNPDEVRMAASALQETLGKGPLKSELPANPTVRDLVGEQKRLRFAQRAAELSGNDNLARQYKVLQQSLNADIEKSAPGTLAKLQNVDARYAKEHAPYFTPHAAPRQIANQSPERIATEIIRPNSDKKAVDKIEKSFSLLDPKQQESVAQAHLRSGIDEASKTADFGKGLVRWWDSHTNVSGNNNKVLRTAYGSQYDDINSTINQFRTAKSRDLSDVVEHVFKQGEREVKLSADTMKLQKEALQKRAQEQIDSALGKEAGHKPHDYRAGMWMGPLLITEGVIHAAVTGNVAHGGAQVISGIGLMISRRAVESLMMAREGRSALKAIARAAPGTQQAFAASRLVQNALKNIPKDEK